ncbi:arylsulfatase [Seonamhaeicola sp.]|uniref:arylsulfatase n=1 Tax=Seonamhaeicola sp. TaxID=1912245 RepID=UPI002618DEDA|nr:arylsulfatase [Seonamhaeicola sp.]
MKSFYHFVLFTIFFFGCNNSQKQTPKQEDERPNIVLILADDLGYSDLGSYGGEINTPNLDSLAYGGLRLTNFYNSGRCCPTRASLLTGVYAHQAGIGNMVYGKNLGGGYQGYLNNTTVTLAEVLKEAGYKTMMSGKWHVGHKEEAQWPTSRGFDRFYGINIHIDSYWKVLEGCDVYLDGKLHIPATADPKNDLHPEQDWYTTDVFTDYGIHFLNEEVKNGKDNKPFFLYMAYNAPHFPLEAPDEDIAKYRGKYMEGWDKLREEKHVRMKKLGVIPQNAVLSPPDNVNWDSLPQIDKENLDFRRAMYAAQIDRMDQNIGRLIQHLKEIGKYDNTLIIFLSDNGCSAERGMFGLKWEENKMANYNEWKEESGWSVSQGQAWANVSNVPFRLYKRYVHQGGTATPFIAHWPNKIKEGQINDYRGHIVDIMATLQDLGEATYPETFNGNKIIPKEGITLTPLFEGNRVEEHDYIFWEHIGNRAVRKGDWKLVAVSQKPWELYNLKEDPTELNNLIEEKPELVSELKDAYFNWAKKADVREWPLEYN